MQIKSADDKQPDIAALENLASRTDIDQATRRRIEQEIRQIRAGVRGERDAAYEIEFHLAANKSRMTIHDLRLELDGRVAQIDHLILNRLLDVWVCESKHFAEGVAVNEHGEWVAFNNHRPAGIPSPIEQNRRHVAVLSDVFSKGLVSLPKRLGITIKPKVFSLVLVSNQARISRPSISAAARIDGLETVVKVDQMWAAFERAYDERSLTALGKTVGADTVETFARQLAALHVPTRIDWAARFGVPARQPKQLDQPASPPAPARSRGLPSGSDGPPVCATCGKRVSGAVVAYCLDHVGRFGGAIHCIDCQKRVGS